MGYLQKFMVVGASALLLSSLSGCTYIIPKDPSVPRYNTVLGERRLPSRNKASMDAAREINAVKPLSDAGFAPVEAMPATQTQTQALAPVAEVQVNNLPPAASALPWTSPTTAMPELPPVDAATRAAAERIDPSIRQIPAENSPYTVAENSFSTVPPYPAMPGSDSPQARLNNVRHGLESARDQAAVARDQLARDAAAEPSMLSPLPNAPRTMVPTQPVPVVPAVITPPAPPQVMYTPAPPVPQQQGYIALPPPPPMIGATLNTPVAPPAPVVIAAPAAPQTFTSAPQVPLNPPTTAPIQLRAPHAFDPMAPVSSAVVASAPVSQPIQLRAPVTMPQTTVVAQPEPMTIPVTPQIASSSSFNPMAVPAGSSAHAGYAGNGFLEPSRYITRRN